MSGQTHNQPLRSNNSSNEQFPTLLINKPQQTQSKIQLHNKVQKFSDQFPALIPLSILPVVQFGAKEVWQHQDNKNNNLKNFRNQDSQLSFNKKSQTSHLHKHSIIQNNKAKQNSRLQIMYALNEKNKKQASRKFECITKQTIKDINKQIELQTEEKDRKSQTSELSQTFVNNSSDSESEDQQVKNWPDFSQLKQKLKKIHQFKLSVSFPTVKHYRFQKSLNHPYSTHYEKARVHKYIEQTSEERKWVKWIRLGKLRIICINCDFNIPSRNGNCDSQGTEDSDGPIFFNRIVKEYWRTTEAQRAKQIAHQIRLAMLEGIDFICLQEICQPSIRNQLLKVLEELKYSAQNQYFFPKNLESHEYLRTTMILSKHPVKFGHLKFQIPEHQNQQQSKFYFPLQAFCEFQVVIGRQVLKVGIVSCHLRSNGEKNSDIRPYKMRQQQVRWIHDFSKRFDKFFCIGDTNIPSSQKFKKENLWVNRKFIDAFDVGQSPIGGTYLYRTKANSVLEQRMDRVWMKRDMKNNTDVRISFKEILLQSCKNMGFNKREMLELDEEKLIYISPSDHEILEIKIQFTKYE